ncbi:hypothetical protein pdam_00004993 [Pocillopora damicornis]|uniref:Uncharacterized protein n=1 Tax=Pocillopora damicornis TaxID=46731 RepID=A0A3M6UVT1_POCDA|nr:hypothetical protein pdam_00004993 [Pocillopora damicornis]
MQKVRFPVYKLRLMLGLLLEAKDHPLLLTKYTFFSQLVANYPTVFFLYENCDKATHLEKLEYIKQIKGLNKAAEHSKNSTMFESFFGVQNEPLFFELLCHRTTIEKLYYELTATKFTARSLRSTSIKPKVPRGPRSLRTSNATHKMTSSSMNNTSISRLRQANYAQVRFFCVRIRRLIFHSLNISYNKINTHQPIIVNSEPNLNERVRLFRWSDHVFLIALGQLFRLVRLTSLDLS